MKFEMVYTPVSDLVAALAFYRDRLGWQEVWREGESTVALQLPGSDVVMMLDVSQDPAGPMFVVDSFNDWRARHGAELDWRVGPMEIPGGMLGGFVDPSGNAVYVLDQATDDSSS